MNKFFKLLPVVAGLTVFLIVLSLGEYMVALEQDRDHQALKVQQQTSVGLVRAKLEREINSTMFLALGLSSFVAATPDFTPAQFEQMAAMLLQLRPTIRNIGLAPDNMISYIYPLQGNEQALGMRYLEHPLQKAAVLRMMAEKQPVVAGPFTLVQGGEGLINRIPIYPTDAQGKPYYWGLASVVVDPAPIYAAAGLDNPLFEFALRGKDAKGADGEVFHGNAALFADPDAVVMDVVVPGGFWQLAGRPLAINHGVTSMVSLFHLLAWACALVCGLLSWLLIRANLQIRTLALHDTLTGSPNRRYLQRVAERQIAQSRRNGRPFSVLHIDIDDFKLINDRYGHKAGDKGLKLVAHRARHILRAADFVARVGGDEFVVLLSDTASNDYLHHLIDRLRNAICSPFSYDDHILSLQISIGWATFPDDGGDLDQLIKNADQRMYQQKTGNKNPPANSIAEKPEGLSQFPG